MRFEAGPVFANVVLADEVNRATPKTQSALLEAMQETAVTIAGERRPLPTPFLLLATQNPVEMEGTYPLPEAQLDRFLFHVALERPGVDEVVEVLRRTTGEDVPGVEAVLDAEAIETGRALVVHESPARGGIGAEIVRRIVSEGFDYLDAPPMVHAGADVPIPFSPPLERACLPQVETIVREIRRWVG